MNGDTIIMHVFLSYPIWFVFFCLALALAYSFFLYKTEEANRIHKSVRIGLHVLRFLSSFLLAFLLLSPFVKRNTTKTERPSVIIAIDQSASMHYAWKQTDSNLFFKQLNQLSKQLSNEYDVKKYAFDANLYTPIKNTFKGNATDISGALDDLHDRFFNTNVGAIILISDGIYNRGSSPLYTEASNAYPIYTVLMGDTTPRKDAKIEQVLCNDIVYLGDKFEIKTELASYNCVNASATIRIDQIGSAGKSNIVSQQSISYTQINDNKSISFFVNATTPGVQHYRITHTPIAGEFTLENNVKDIYVQVLDGRDKILLLADGPHPDVSALKQAIERNKNYTIDIAYANTFTKSFDEYQVVILHQIPGENSNNQNMINTLQSKNISVWYILGSASVPASIEKLSGLVQFSKIRNTYNDVHAIRATTFSLFTIDPEYSKTLEQLPPLTVPFGEYSCASTNTLLHQKIGSVQSNYPLWCMGEALQQKQAFLMGEGLWRWRMYNYQLKQNTEAVDDIIQKTVQYLSVKNDKRKFKTLLTKKIYDEHENVLVSAQMYNDNYQLINSCDVQLVLTDEKGKNFTYSFSKNNSAYILDIGQLSQGNYSYIATSQCNGKSYTDEGKFSVSALQLEAQKINADAQMMLTLAKKKNAAMVYPKELLQLEKEIRAQKEIKPLIYETSKTSGIIHIKWIFFLILAMLSIEWFVRKYQGLY